MAQSIREYGLAVISTVHPRTKEKIYRPILNVTFCAAYFPGSELTLACVRILSAAIRKESSPGGGVYI